MRIYRGIERLLLNLLNAVWKAFIYIHEVKNIIKKRKIWSQVKLTNEQKKQIDEFYMKNYGRKIPYCWHRLYTSYTGNFDYKYLPEIIYSTQIEPLYNSRNKALPYEDKNMLEVLFKRVKEDSVIRIPKTYIICVNGRYYDENRTRISKKKALEILYSLMGEYVLKITIDTNSGRGVRMLSLVDGVDERTGESIEKVLNFMGDNFVIQERIRPHLKFAHLYEKSVNTIRVISYQTIGGIKTSPMAMRMGRGGKEVDNGHAGGVFIGIDEKGCLLKEAFSEMQERFTKHPDSGVIFEGYSIPMLSHMKEEAVVLHSKLPMFQFISWDFTVDDDEKIVLLEINLHSQSLWIPQMGCGKAAFGNDTDEILALKRNNKRK